MMKTVLPLLLLSLSCSNSTRYSVSGSIEGAGEGDSLILFYSSNGKSVSIVDTTTIVDGRFFFEGETAEVGIYYIGYENGGESHYILFFLEPGEITADIKRERSLFYGTPNNERNRLCEDTLAYYLNMLAAVERCFYTDSLDIEKMTRLGIKGYETQKALIEHIHKSVEENTDNLFGLFMLVVYNDFFEPQHFSKLLKRIPGYLINRSNNSLYDIAVDIDTRNRGGIR